MNKTKNKNNNMGTFEDLFVAALNKIVAKEYHAPVDDK